MTDQLNFVTLFGRAQAQVEASPLWKRFIDGTPLANDIAAWMASFALESAPPAQPAERVPEGWVLVPREPTEAMRRRGADRWIEASENAMTRKDEEEAARCAWAAMLAAAPADGKEGVR